MAAEFIAKDNICGQNLLQIVAVGNAIIAEVCRLKDHIPDVFQYVQKHCQYLVNFSLMLSQVQTKCSEEEQICGIDPRFRLL